MIEKPFEQRTKLIRKIIHHHPYKIRTAEQLITSDEKQAEKFYKQAIKDGQEGVMIKNLTAEYRPGARVGFMLKLKPAENEFDLVITKAEYGTGKRGGILSSYTLSCFDEEKNKLVEIGKASTGLKEKEEEGLSFNELTRLLKPLIIKEHGKEVIVKPKIIVTILFQNIQKSPTYESGFALRFPRIIALREDKPLKEVASMQEVIKEFKRMELKREY
jgi:DNA ligase-1